MRCAAKNGSSLFPMGDDQENRLARKRENMVLLEQKSVERVLPAHKKQVHIYLRLTGLKLGYLLNFGEAVLKSGITRCVNGLEEEGIPRRRGDAEYL